MRPSIIGWAASDDAIYSMNDRHWESAMLASLALDLLADTRRERSGVRS